MSKPLTGRLTYKGNHEHVVGQSTTSPRLTSGGGLRYIHWVATDAVFDPDTGKTTVEFDGKELDNGPVQEG
jgi:hypothetical protein